MALLLRRFRLRIFFVGDVLRRRAPKLTAARIHSFVGARFGVLRSPMVPAREALVLAARCVIGCSLGLVGCFSPSEGIEPPADRFYYPVGLALDTAAEHLYVVNSNFDLQYRSGNLISLDLGRIAAVVPRPCSADADCTGTEYCDNAPTDENSGAPAHWCVTRGQTPCAGLGERPENEQLIIPGRCGYIDLAQGAENGGPLITDVVKIGAFARSMVYMQRPPSAPDGPPGRLAVSVAGDATLHWIDVKKGRMECGQGANDGACDDRHRVGDDPSEENSEGLRLPTEPFGLDAAADGGAIVVSHQTLSAASLFVHDWSLAGPHLEDVVSSLPARPVAVASLPVPKLVPAAQLGYRPGFLVAFRQAATIDLLRYYDDAAAAPAHPFLVRSRTSPISENTVGSDSRGIAIDASAREAAEAACAQAAGLDEACLADAACLANAGDPYRQCVLSAAATPLGVYVASRAPASLLVGRTSGASNPVPTSDLPTFNDSVPLPFGPSTTVVGNIINRDGLPEPRVFVVCYDARWIFIYNPKTRAIEADVKTGRGPQGLVVDAKHGRAYVGHFLDSYVGVVSLDQRYPETYAKLIATLGKPTPPRTSK